MYYYKYKKYKAKYLSLKHKQQPSNPKLQIGSSYTQSNFALCKSCILGFDGMYFF